jgi:hypothetical protein
VLDAGIKKSPEKGKIPKWQAERLEKRLSTAKRYCTENHDELKAAYDQRLAKKKMSTQSATRAPMDREPHK